MRNSLVGIHQRMTYTQKEEKAHVLANTFCQFNYNMDVIPAHRDFAKEKSSPISPIFWSSLQKYHFVTADGDGKGRTNGLY